MVTALRMSCGVATLGLHFKLVTDYIAVRLQSKKV